MDSINMKIPLRIPCSSTGCKLWAITILVVNGVELAFCELCRRAAVKARIKAAMEKTGV